MKKALRAIPLPICSVMLSLATLGNILSQWSIVRGILGIMAALIGVVILLKIIVTSDQYKTDMQNPVIASTFVTFTMAIVVLSTYIKPFSVMLGKAIWLIGLALHIAVIVYVIIRFILPSKKILPSYYVTFVGIVVASVTSPAFGLKKVGFAICIIGFAAFVWLSFFILKNLFKADYIPRPAAPTKVIVAAPLSLVLLGYINSAEAVNTSVAIITACVAFLLTLLGVYFMGKTIGKSFNPAYAAYTFPLVISSFAMKGMAGVCAGSALGTTFTVIHMIELVLALLVVLWVLLRYILHFVRTVNAAPAEDAQK